MAVDRTFLYVWTLDSNSGSAPTVSNVPSSPPPDCSAAGKGVSLLQHAKRKRQERQRLSPSPPLKHREHRHQSSVESQWKRKDGQRPSPPSHLHPHSDPVELLRRFPVGVHRCRRRRRRLQHPKERHRLKKRKAVSWIKKACLSLRSHRPRSLGGQALDGHLGRLLDHVAVPEEDRTANALCQGRKAAEAHQKGSAFEKKGGGSTSERRWKHIRKAAHSRRKAVEAHQKGGGSTTERQRI